MVVAVVVKKLLLWTWSGVQLCFEPLAGCSRFCEPQQHSLQKQYTRARTSKGTTATSGQAYPRKWNLRNIYLQGVVNEIS